MRRILLPASSQEFGSPKVRARHLGQAPEPFFAIVAGTGGRRYSADLARVYALILILIEISDEEAKNANFFHLSFRMFIDDFRLSGLDSYQNQWVSV